MKMRFWENDFEKMFDEAVEELEKNQEENENNAWQTVKSML